MRKVIHGAAVATAVLLAACGSNEPQASVSDTVFETTTIAAAPPKGNTSTAVNTWVSAVAADTPEKIEPALALSAPGSPAELYASYRLASAKAGGNSGPGSQLPPPDVTVDDNGNVNWCFQNSSDEVCYTTSNVQLDDAGKVVDVAINGQPLAGRILGPGQVVEMPGGTAQRLYAFEPSTGDALFVTVQFTAGPTSLKTPHSASYVGPDSTQITSDLMGSVTPDGDVVSGATATAVYAFPKAHLPGKFVIQDVCTSDYRTCNDVTLPVTP